MAGWLCFKMSRDNKRFNDEKAIAGGKCDYHTLVSCCLASRRKNTNFFMAVSEKSREEGFMATGLTLKIGGMAVNREHYDTP